MIIMIIMIITIRDWSTTTAAPTSPPPAIVLDPIMEEMMNMVNWTELEARFFKTPTNIEWGMQIENCQPEKHSQRAG